MRRGWWKKLTCMVLFKRSERLDVYATIADLLAAEFAIEKAFAVAAQAVKDQGGASQAWILGKWRAALQRGRFAEEVSEWVPASEAMIFNAYGRVDATALFAGAARVADLRGRQSSALAAALAMPTLAGTMLIVMLWGAGGFFMPVLIDLVPRDEWPPHAALLGAACLWLYAQPWLFLGTLLAVIVVLRTLTLHWTGPGRARLDGIPPFSLYRTVVGSAFLFVLLEYLRAGLDLNDRTFEELKSSSSRYTRHRIQAIQDLMTRGRGLGTAMIAAGHGFPDPSLAPVVAALDGVPSWETKLARFVDRWVLRSEALLKARAFILNAILMLMVTVVTFGAIDTLFTVMRLAGRTTGRY